MSDKMPPQGSLAEREANTLDNKALAGRLSAIAHRPHSYNREWRESYLLEAAKRLAWPDNYEKHLS